MPLETKVWNIQDHITRSKEQTAYMEAALETCDEDTIATAIGDIARARGITAFAEQTGLSREAIYKAFRPGGNPTLRTLTAATKALGLRLAVRPASDT